MEKLVEKSDGNGNLFMVPNPDYYNEETGKKRKKIVTNFTPKKKKRK